ncbi:MAG: hypothetical protein MI808_15790 [Pseudomonadales bacterium]|nr:hypothetical protein [Pseudomonadales bacterium]
MKQSFLHTKNRIHTGKAIALIMAVLLFSGCKKEMPDEGLVPGIPWLLGSTLIQLSPFGYEKAEYFIQGTATSYESPEALTVDGKWSVEPVDEAEFRTRMVVYRPTDPAKFNGTVIVEWLNVSGGTEASSEWIMAHTELLRSGYAWIGVSAQKAGIDGAGVTILPISLALKKINPSRYEKLVHPGDKYSYDIFSQVGMAVTDPQRFNPLGELQAQRVIASGESQSADFLLTYVNAIAPRDNVFDAYYIHSRIHGSAALQPDPDATDLDLENRDSVWVRDDLNVPVLMLQTESDTTVLGAYKDTQPDTPMLRVWEVAGTAHADRYVGNLGLTDKGDNPNVAAVVETRYAVPVIAKCGKPINSGPQHFVVKASLAALDNWLRTGVAPESADRYVFDEETASLVRDQYGNVLGGIRTPYVDVPIATLSGEGQDGSDVFCDIYGTTELFDEITLMELYPDHETYVALVEESVDDAVAKGYLLEPDGALIKTWAQQSDVGVYSLSNMQ